MWCKIYSSSIKLTLLVGFLLILGAVNAQTVPKGISFQAVINDDEGNPMQNKDLSLRIVLTNDPSQGTIYYVENQEVRSNQFGQIDMIIGKEAKGQDLINRIPWAAENIWMNIELLDTDGSSKLISQGSFMAVPFAFHAESVNKIIPLDTAILRNDQSIIWNTSGNFKTQPHVHYLGTADEKALYFKTNNTTRMVISAEGQTTYYTDPGLNGSDDDKTMYPIVIQDGEQGIFIEIMESRSEDNNFLTFADSEGIHGTVEGQTAAEYYSSFDYLFPLSIKVFEIALEIANGVAGGIEAGGLAGALSVAVAAKSISLVEIGLIVALKTAQLIAWQVEVAMSIGVSYTTGSADYAEWLEKSNPVDQFMAGEVVGVKNGLISRNTADADHLLVISSNPGVLGNTPEEAEKYRFEKVAFKGQVPVFVVGEVNLGDYILPSGNNDGMAIAIASEDMKSGDYGRIIGVAWEAAVEGPLNAVNVAIGINTNDMATKVEDIEQKLNLISGYLEGEAQLVDGKITPNAPAQETFVQSKIKEQTQLQPLFSDETYDQYFDDHAEVYQQVFDEAREQLQKKGIDLSAHPMIETLYDDPVAFFKAMRRDPRMQTYMGYFDKQILSGATLTND